VRVEWKKVQAVIFDVDGTLYDQRRLRVMIIRDLITHYLMRPHRWRDLLILHQFRLLHEEMATSPGMEGNQLMAQYHRTSERTRTSVDRVKWCVQKWILSHPLTYLSRCRYPGLLQFCQHLQKCSIRLAVFSDYPAAAKLHALGLPDMIAVCSMDPEVKAIKPDPKGLLLTVEKLNVPISACLFIGDRDDRDGECARRLNMPYLIKSKRFRGNNQFRSYEELDRQCMEGRWI
jgi:beta-phosphoglucomutase-like phosphatase (HAD superfamily)